MSKAELMCDCNVIHPEIVARARQNQSSAQSIDQLSELFKVLSDPTRIKILQALDRNEMCVCDIANVLDMTKSSISHQLALLRNKHIVKYCRRGREIYYTLDDDHITAIYELGLQHIQHLQSASVSRVD